MKAVKVNKIQWNLNSIEDNRKKENTLKNLPVVMGFKAKDEFNVTEKVPSLLQKRYGYPIDAFSFVECPIAENVEQLLKLNAPKGKEDKDMFTQTGNLTATGKLAFETLKRNVKWRIELEDQGVADTDMPAILDTVMIGIEKISGMSWTGNNPDVLFGSVIKKIRDKHDYAYMDEEEPLVD